MPLDFEDSLRAIRNSAFAPFCPALARAVEAEYLASPHGNEQKWDEALAKLPAITSNYAKFGDPVVRIGEAGELDRSPQELAGALRRFMPWRKGPWSFFGVDIDT